MERWVESSVPHKSKGANNLNDTELLPESDHIQWAFMYPDFNTKELQCI